MAGTTHRKRRLPRFRLRTRRVRLPLGLGKRFVVASDWHADEDWMPRERIAQVVDAINAVDDVDAVLLPGDFVSFDASTIRWAAPELGRITAPAWATLGNHDHWTDAELVTAALRDAGITVLANEVTEIAGVEVAAVDSLYTGTAPAMFLQQIAREHPDAVVLAHEPAAATHHTAPLQISGHTHHGQVKVPIITRALVLPAHSEPYWAGLYKRAERSWAYTTAGVGFSTVGFRVFAPPEIVVLDL